MKKTILSLTAVLAMFASESVYASHAELCKVTDTRLPQVLRDFNQKSKSFPILNLQQLKAIFKATEIDMYQFLHALQVTELDEAKKAFSLSDSNFGSVAQFLHSNLHPLETQLFVHDLSNYVNNVYSAYVYKQFSFTVKDKKSRLFLSKKAKEWILEAFSIHKKMTTRYMI